MPIERPDSELFSAYVSGSDGKSVSTMVFVRLMTDLIKDKNVGERVVHSIDEARTFGMEALFRQIGIYSSEVKNTNLRMLIRLCGIRKLNKELC